ncbi:MAG: hypothetical protein QMC34_02485, partial [Flavobacteriales bacterium]
TISCQIAIYSALLTIYGCYQQAKNEPTAQIAHLIFADTKANAGKIKRAIFHQRSTRIMRLSKY